MMRMRSLVIGLVAALVLPAGIAGASTTPSMGTDASGRVAAQAAVERVLWAHRIWPEANPGPKPSLEKVLPTSAIQAKVEDTLRMTVALERLAGRTITGADLQGEIDRQATHSRQPDVLAELWAALGDDPALVAETLARPVLVDRELRAWFAATHPDASVRHVVGLDPGRHGRRRGRPRVRLPARATCPRLPAGPGSWDPTHALPEANAGISAVWTGTEMIVWGGTEVGGSKFNSGSRYDPATDTWRTTSGVNAPFPRKQHSAVWTGTEMIVWGGCGLLDEHFCQINTGGRYDPLTDTWEATATAGAPSPRIDHTAVWTGTQMIVWGGCRFVNDACNAQSLGNSGGRYDPSTNSWQPTSTTGRAHGPDRAHGRVDRLADDRVGRLRHGPHQYRLRGTTPRRTPGRPRQPTTRPRRLATGTPRCGPARA